MQIKPSFFMNNSDLSTSRQKTDWIKLVFYTTILYFCYETGSKKNCFKRCPYLIFTIMTNINLTTTLLITFALGFGINVCSAQPYQPANADQIKPKFSWPDGKVMAISLTFDDARLSQV